MKVDDGCISVSGLLYVRGDGSLANFPSTGGGGGQIFYFNGNVSQGTIGGNNYYELGTEANTGPAANFTRATTGVIASFITDVNSPNHLIIPSGVWTIDVYLSETGGGSNNAEIVAVLKVYNGSTFTTIATSPLEQITNGNVVDLYTFAISVPNTLTAATDRVVIEFDIQNTNGKTVTLYTESNKIGEVHSTYAIGLSSLNGLTENTQNFAVGTSGTDFAINSAGSTHTFNLPTASGSNRGALSSADWSTFNSKVGTTRAINTSSPLSGGGDLSADRTLSIADSVADGATKGAAAFTASDFNSSSGVISLDYANGQKASAAQPGFLSAADWSTFNSKVGTDSVVFASAPNTGHTNINGATSYWALTGSAAINATENARIVVMPVAGTLKNFYVRVGAGAGASGSIVLTVRKNGADTAITLTFTSASGSNFTISDTTNSVSVAAGDRITIGGTNNGTSQAGTIVSMSLILERGQLWSAGNQQGTRPIDESTSPIYAGDFTPALQWDYLFSQIISDAGFELEAGTLLGIMSEYHMPWLNSQRPVASDSFNDLLFQVETSAPILVNILNPYYVVPADTEIYDNANDFNPATYTYTTPALGYYTFEAVLQLSPLYTLGTDLNINVGLLINGVLQSGLGTTTIPSVAGETYERTFTFRVPIGAASTVQLVIVNTFVAIEAFNVMGTWTLLDVELLFGQTFFFDLNAPM